MGKDDRPAANLPQPDQTPEQKPEVYAIQKQNSGYHLTRRGFWENFAVGACAAATTRRGARAEEGKTPDCTGLYAHDVSVLWMAVTEDGKTLISLGGDAIRFWSLPAGRLFKTIKCLGEANSFVSASLAPNGKTLASVDSNGIRLWSFPTGVIIKKLSKDADAKLIAFSPDSKTLFSLSESSVLKSWSVSDGKLLKTLETKSGAPLDFLVTEQGQMLLASEGEDLQKWLLNDGTLCRMRCPGAEKIPTLVALSPDGTYAATTGEDHCLRIWVVDEHKMLFEAQDEPITWLAFHPSGKVLVSADEGSDLKVRRVPDGAVLRTDKKAPGKVRWANFQGDDQVQVWVEFESRFATALPSSETVLTAESNYSTRSFADPETGWVGSLTSNAVRFFSSHLGPVSQFGDSGSFRNAWLSPDGTRALTQDEKGQGRLWSVKDGQSSGLPGDLGSVKSIALSSNGTMDAVLGADGEVTLWSLHEGVKRGLDHPSAVLAIAPSPDNSLLATSCADSMIRVFSLPEQRLTAVISDPGRQARHVAISTDNNLLASVDSTGTVRLWQLPGGQALKTLEGQAGGGLGFSRDGRWVASGTPGGTVRLWSTTDGTLVKTLAGHKGPVRDVAFSVSGKLLISSGEDKTIRVWSVPAGTETVKLKGHSGAVNSVAVTDDDQFIVSGSSDKTVRIWSLATGKSLATLKAKPDKPVQAVAVDPKARFLAATGDDGVVRVWSIKEKRPLFAFDSSASSLAFTADGRTLIAGGGTRKVSLWSLPDFRLMGIEGPVTAIALDSKGKWLITADNSDTVKVWSTSDQTLVRSLKAGHEAPDRVAISPNGAYVSAGWKDTRVHRWRMNGDEDGEDFYQDAPMSWIATTDGGNTVCAGERRLTVRGADREGQPVLITGSTISSMCASLDGELLAAALTSGSILVWRLGENDPFMTIQGVQGGVLSLGFSADKSIVAAVTELGQIRSYPVFACEQVALPLAETSDSVSLARTSDRAALLRHGEVELWDLKKKELLKSLKSPLGTSYEAFRFSPQGDFLLATTFNEAHLWEITDGRLACIYGAPHQKVRSFAFSKDGRKLALLFSGDSSLHIGRLPGGELELENAPFVSSIALAGHRKILITGSRDSRIHLWSLPDAAHVSTVKGKERVVDVAASEDGKMVAACDSRGAVGIWAFPEGKLVKELETGTAEHLAITPDGRLLVTAQNVAIRLWSLPDGGPRQCLYDPAVTSAGTDAMRYRQMGPKTFTLPCGSPIPAGAVCICNCVSGSTSYETTQQVCICDTITVAAGTPLPAGTVCICNTIAVGTQSSGEDLGTDTGYGGHYWYPN